MEGRTITSDLDVESLSEALRGVQVDVIVSGSIAAVESVRFIRSLRRLGASVTPWLTQGGAQFVTPLALSWAAGCAARTEFAGDASHIALGHLAVIAPASASFIANVAHGITSTPSSALATSYLGQRKPVYLLPNMHDSLANAPAVAQNVQTLASQGVRILEARHEEGKRKFPDPATLADIVAHAWNAQRRGKHSAVVSMGSTRGYIDDVRYISNYSSGALGSMICEELYRLGVHTEVVLGPCPKQPRVFSKLTNTLTNEDMQAALHSALAADDGATAAVLAASVLDFAPKAKAAGKLASRDLDELNVAMGRTPKIIAGINPKSAVKVGFKLETNLTPERAKDLAHRYMTDYGLSLMVINDLSEVDLERHTATLFERHAATEFAAKLVVGKRAVAHAVAAHVSRQLQR